jgi:Protein of unknown function (DUF2934)
MSAKTRHDPQVENVRLRSYLIWEHEGCQHGRDREYWLRAEQELKQEMNSETARVKRNVRSQPSAITVAVLPGVSHGAQRRADPAVIPARRSTAVPQE